MVEAEETVRAGINVADFSRRFFGPDGRLATHCKTVDERRKVVASPLSGRLQALLAKLRTEELEQFEQSISGR